MKKLILILITMLFSLTSFAEYVGGVVVVGEGGCTRRDYIVIHTNTGYVYAQEYGGSYNKGNQVVGDLNSYGFQDVLVNSSSGRLYIDGYDLSKSEVTEKCFELD